MDQHFITDKVTVRIVDALEPIGIEHQHRHGLAGVHGAEELTGERVVQPAPISQAGQRVDRGGLLVEALHPIGVLQHAVVVAHSAGQQAKHVSRNHRYVLHEPPELVAFDRHDGRIAVRKDVCRNATLVEQRQFADALSRTNWNDWTRGLGKPHAQRALQHEVHHVVFVACSEQPFARR